MRRLWLHPAHLIWAALAYLPFLGKMSVPLTGDQKVYLSTAIEMRRAGQWLQPLLFGEPSYYKPPLQYWATLAGWKLFGFGLWGAFFPSFVVALLTAWFLGEIALMLHERRSFVSSGLWFMAALGTATYGMVAQMEIYLCFFYAASWWAALKFLDRPFGERDRRWLYLAFAIAGVSAWVKSPLYSAFWVLGFWSYLLVSGEWEAFRSKHLWRACALGVAIGASWYAWILSVDGARFWNDYVLRETLEKGGGNSGGPLSIWLALLHFCFPFTLLLFPSLRALWKRRNRSARVMKFILCWSWAPALFFTLYPYRVKTYLFLLVPALALSIDWAYLHQRRSRLFRAFMVATGAVMAVVFAALAFVLARAGLAPDWVLAGFALTGGWALVCGLRDWMRELTLAGVAAVFFFHAACASIGEGDLAGLRGFAAGVGRDRELAMLDEDRGIWHEVGLISVALARPVRRAASLDEATQVLLAGGALVLSDEQSRLMHELDARVTGSGERRELQSVPWTRWKGKAKLPLGDLLWKGRSGVQDFDERTKREFRIIFLQAPAG